MDDYLVGYKQLANIAESLLSKQGIHEFVKSTAEYKKADGNAVEQLLFANLRVRLLESLHLLGELQQ